jgi:WD40 repeat protein/Ca2+-binding EF-hand superfamily protein
MSAFLKARKLAAAKNKRLSATTTVRAADMSHKDLMKIVDTLYNNLDAKTKKGSTPRRTLEQTFRNIDVDRSGDIEFTEFSEAMGPYLQGVHESIVMAVFEYFDADGSGTLSVDEFVSCLLEKSLPRQHKVGQKARKTARESSSNRSANVPKFGGVGMKKAKERYGNVTLKSAEDSAPFYRGDRDIVVVRGGVKKQKDTTGIESRAGKLVEHIKHQIVSRGGTAGIHGISRILRIMDDSGDQRISKEELKYGLKDMKVIIDDDDVDLLFMYFDTDGNGSINFDEFLLGLTGPLSKRREELVMKAFALMDKTGDGEITVDDLAGVYDCSLMPDVISGKITETEALRAMLNAFDQGEKDGIVTKDEFKAYYRNIGAAIDSDDYFELMIRNAWHISGGKGAYANTTSRRVLVTHEDGHQSVEEITDDLGIAPDDIATMKQNLKKRGIRAKAIKTFGAAGAAKKGGNKASGGKGGHVDRVFGRANAKKRVTAPGAAAAPFANDHSTKPSSSTVAERPRSRSSQPKSISVDTESVSSRLSRMTPRPTEPLPNTSKTHALLKRLRQEVILRGQGRATSMLSNVDRMQHHITSLQLEVGKKILATVCARYGSGARLHRRDFGFAIRAFTETGTKPMDDAEINALWHVTEGGDKDMLINLLFPPRGPGGRLVVQKMKGRSTEEYEALMAMQYEDDLRPEVLTGPFDSGHFGERAVEPISQGEVPKRMRYRYSRTSVQPPSGWDPVDMARSGKRPDVDLELEWVYGCNGRCSNSFHATSTGELIYNIAAVVVVYDPVKLTQRHFIQHDDDITVLTIDHSKQIAASGQLGANPRIIIWEISSLKVLSVVGSGGFFQRSICAVSFLGGSSSYICGIGADDHHALGIWKWRLTREEQEGLEIHGMAAPGEPTPGKFIAESGCQNGAPPQIYAIASPAINSSPATQGGGRRRSVFSFATLGCNHTKFWTLDLNQRDRPLLCKNSRYGKANKLPRKTFCGKYIDGANRLVTGGSNGFVYVFNTAKGECLQSFTAHKGPVYSLCTLSSGVLLTGGADAEAKRWRVGRASRGTKEYDFTLITNLNLSAVHSDIRSAEQRSGPAHHDTIIAPGGSSAAPMFKSKTKVSSAPWQTEIKETDGEAKNTRGNSGPTMPAGSCHAVRTFAITNSQAIYCTTTRGDIWSIQLGDESSQRPKSAAAFGRPSASKSSIKLTSSVGSSAECISRSHYGPLYGLATHPSNQSIFATVGEDKQLSVWNSESHKQVCAIMVPAMARSCHFSPDATEIAVGLVNGAFLVYAYHKATSYRGATLSLSHSKHDCLEAIDDLKYSPNGQYLAVSSHDNYIDIYDVKHKYTKVARCKGHTSYVTHIDWSRDSRILQSNCGAYEIIYWDIPSGAPLRSTLDKVEADTDWYSWTCVLGFSVMGIWPEYSDGTDVNALQKSADGKYVVTADDFGQVKVFNAPCVVQHAPYSAYRGHSSHVMNVRFLLGDESVVSVGGWDCGVFQWKFLRTGIDSRMRTKWKPLSNWKNC